MYFNAAQTQGAIGSVVKPQAPGKSESAKPNRNLSQDQFGKGASGDADGAAEAGAEAGAAGAGEAAGAAGAGAGLAELAPLALL